MMWARHDHKFQKRNSHFRGFPEDTRTLLKMSEDVPMTLLNSPDSNGLQTFERFATVIKSKERVVIKLGHKVNIKLHKAPNLGEHLIEFLLLIMC